MKNLLILLTLLLISEISFSQHPLMDSLQQVLNEYTKNDTGRVQLLNQLSYYSRRDTPDESFRFAKDAEKLAIEIEYYNGNYNKSLTFFEKALVVKKDIAPDYLIGDSYLRIGRLNFDLGNLEKAEDYLTKSQEIFEKRGAISNAKIVSVNIAAIKQAQGKFKEAEIILLDAINELEKNGDKYNVANIMAEFARLKKEMGEYEKALEYYNKSKDLAEQIDAPYFVAQSQLEIGTLYQSMGDLDQALLNSDKAIKTFSEMNDLYGLSQAHDAKGGVQMQKKQFKKALENRMKALELMEQVGDKELLSIFHTNIGKVHLELKDYDKALHYLSEGEKIATEIDNLTQIGNCNLQLANYYQATGALESARTKALKALTFFKENNLTDRSVEVNHKLFEIEKQVNNFEKALLYHETHHKIKDEIYTQNAQKRITEERVKQNVKDAETAQAQAEERAGLLAQRNQLYTALGLALLGILGIGSYFFFQLRNSKQQIESQNLQLQQLNTTKDKFFGIIAHDIRSPIVALDGVGEQMEYYLKKDQPEKLERLAERIDSTAKRLNGLLDNLLNWALLQQGVIPYHPKSLNIREVSENTIQMFQHNADAKNITLDLQIKDHINIHADESSMNTILRNLVSNAIKFTPEGGTVSLNTETKDNKVFILINDTGTGISTKKLSNLFSLEKTSEKGTAGEKGTGLGLTLVKELTELNKGSIDVNSILGQGSLFKLGLPIVV